MANRAAQLRDLMRLTDAALRAEQARMAQCNRAILALREQISALTTRPDDPTLRTDTLDPAQRAGADIRWTMWVEERRKALNQELAQMLVVQDGIRASLAKAFGKNQATIALSDQEDAARRLRARRQS